jgi:prepilin-type N-terminal cleavage/methylation domain-containing protein
MKTTARPRDDRGFTLLELIVTLFAATIVVGAVMQFYVSQHYHVNQQMEVADLQQNLRAAMQEISDQLRMAGYGLPTAMDPIIASNTDPDSVQFFYRRTPTSQAELTQDMTDVTEDLYCVGHDLCDFSSSTWAYIFDPSTNTGEFFYMTAVDDAGDRIRHTTTPLSKAYATGSEVYAVEIFKYYVDRSDPVNPVLVRSRQGEGPVVFSEGIDSLEFEYLMPTGAWSHAPPAGRLVRAVRITVTAVGRSNTDGVLDGPRQRRLTSRVNIRNLAM